MISPGGSVDKESACNAGDARLIPGLGRSPGGGNGSPLQYSCLENPVDRGVWWVTVRGVESMPAALKARSFNHWTAREVLVQNPDCW